MDGLANFRRNMLASIRTLIANTPIIFCTVVTQFYLTILYSIDPLRLISSARANLSLRIILFRILPDGRRADGISF